MPTEFEKEMEIKKTKYDIRITWTTNTKYILVVNPGKNITLSGQWIDNRWTYYLVTQKALDTIEKEYSTVTDF